MAQVDITKDGKATSYEMDDAAYSKLQTAAEDNSYTAQEYPKYVDTPAGPAYVATKADEDALRKDMPKEGDVAPQKPLANAGAAIVTPMFPGDGYAYVDNVRVSDERNLATTEALTPRAIEPAKGPIRTVSEAAVQDVTFTTGDHVEAGKAKAQENKDALADAKAADGEKSGMATADGTAVTSAADMSTAIPMDTVAISAEAPVPNAPGQQSPGAPQVQNADAVPTSHPNTGGDMGDTAADGTPANPEAADKDHA